MSSVSIMKQGQVNKPKDDFSSVLYRNQNFMVTLILQNKKNCGEI